MKNISNFGRLNNMNELNWRRVQVFRNEMRYRKFIILPKIISGLEQYEGETLTMVKNRMITAGAIFQHLPPDENDPDDIVKNDGKRHQLIVQRYSHRNKELAFIKDLSERVSETVKKIFGSNLKQSPVSILYSEKGCDYQDLHYDYHPSSNSLVCKCFAAILFLENESKLIVRSGSTIIDQQFNQGDLIIFRGDLAHAGSAYFENDNVRLHYYFDHVNYKREKDATYPKNVCDPIVAVHNSIVEKRKRSLEAKAKKVEDKLKRFKK